MNVRTNSIYRWWLFIFLFSLSISSLFSIQQETYSFSGKMVVKNILDLDGNGYDDLVFVEEDLANPENLTILFYANKGDKGLSLRGRFPLQNVNVFDFADLNQDGVLDLVYVYGKSLYSSLIEFKDGKVVLSAPKKMFSVHCMYSYPLFYRVIQEDFALDVDGDKKPDFIFPEPSGVLFYSSKDNYSSAKLLKAEIGGVVSALQQRKFDFLKGSPTALNVLLPKMDRQDVNKDGYIDLIFYGRRFVYFYLLTEAGLSKDALIYEIPKVKERDVARGSNNAARMPTLKIFHDVNGDKYLDLIVKRQIPSVKIMDLKTAVEVYYGVEGSKKFEKADLRFEKEGILVVFPPKFGDFNQDGHLDIQDLHFELSVGKAISTFISKQTTGVIRNFLLDKDGELIEDRNIRRLRLDMDFKPPFIFSIFSIFGDHDGDGIKDLMIGSLEDSEINVFRGKPNNEFESQPFLELDGELFLKININDFDKDKKDDLIMFDPRGKQFKIIYF